MVLGIARLRAVVLPSLCCWWFACYVVGVQRKTPIHLWGSSFRFLAGVLEGDGNEYCLCFNKNMGCVSASVSRHFDTTHSQFTILSFRRHRTCVDPDPTQSIDSSNPNTTGLTASVSSSSSSSYSQPPPKQNLHHVQIHNLLLHTRIPKIPLLPSRRNDRSSPRPWPLRPRLLPHRITGRT